jgi:hypothetical protein
LNKFDVFFDDTDKGIFIVVMALVVVVAVVGVQDCKKPTK